MNRDIGTTEDTIPSDCLLCGRQAVAQCHAEIRGVERFGRCWSLTYGLCDCCIDPESQAQVERRIGRLVEVPECGNASASLGSSLLDAAAQR